jgi:hypothetical protein
MRVLMRQYRDTPMDLADASLVVAAERLNLGSLGITVELAEKPVSCSANLLKTLSRVLSYISVCTATPKDPKSPSHLHPGQSFSRLPN